MRIAIVCPGRGSYTRTELGSLTQARADDRPQVRPRLLELADAHRRRIGRATVTDLDRAAAFGSQHLAGENAAALIATGALIDAAMIATEHEVACVLGNSMGFYLALGVAGALDESETLRLVDEMGGQQIHGVIGGQLLYPLVGEDWRPDGAREARLTRAMETVRAAGHEIFLSIALGGLVVLAGEDAALAALERELPKIEFGRRPYPFRLLGHSAFHTPLLGESSRRGQEALQDLRLRAPAHPLIDGRGHVFRPLSTDPSDLFRYTLDTQVVCPFDFTTALRVALREYAPDAVVLLGPGDSLGGAIAQVMISEGWRGLQDRESFLRAQASDRPPLLSMSRTEQRVRLFG